MSAGIEMFARLGNEELWNASRLKAYLDAGYAPPGVLVSACGECDTLPSYLCDEDNPEVMGAVYTYPSDPEHPAPWYDALDPSSADFAGLLVLGIEGADTAEVERAVTDRLDDGAVLGRTRYRARVLEVDAVLIGRTCCSLSSGLRWLTSALRQACSGCNGSDLTYFDCCPAEAAACTVPGGVPDTSTLGDHERLLRNVGLSEGVTVTERLGSGCGTCRAGCAYMRVKFTLTAGDPYAYSGIQCFVENQPIIGEDSVAECVVWVPAEGSCADATSGGCGELCPVTDPACPTPAMPPSFPRGAVCGGIALSSIGSCYTITADDVPDWQEMVLYLTITAGATDLRSVHVKIYRNPLERDVSLLNDCDLCGSFVISFLQHDAAFVLDGRDRRFWVTCPGGQPNNGARLVSASGGQPFRWPVLDCGGAYTVCVYADSTTTTEDATFSVCGYARTAGS